MQIFANQVKVNEDGEVDMIHGKSPRYNFDSFFNSFILIFIVLT
jgi:hypothetical protein